MLIINSGLIFLATHYFNFLWCMENIGTFSLGFNCIFEDLKSRLIVEICRNEQNSLREKNKQGRDWNLWKVGGLGGGWDQGFGHNTPLYISTPYIICSILSFEMKMVTWRSDSFRLPSHLKSNQSSYSTVDS